MSRPLVRPSVALIALLAALLVASWATHARAADEDEAAGEAPRAESGAEREFFRRLFGGDPDTARVNAMWRAMGTARSEPAAPAAGAHARSAGPNQVEAINQWQLLGPDFADKAGGGRVTGRVRDFDAVNIRALAASGGLWSLNIFGGTSLTDNLPASWFGSFATSPLDANTIVVGTGEYRRNSGTGLYRTTDGGATWTAISMPGNSNTFSRVRWESDGSAVYASSDNGFFRSTDGGAHWTQTYIGSNIASFSTVPGVAQMLFLIQDNGGIRKSTDGGQTWTQLGGPAPSNSSDIGVISATYSSATSSVWVYAGWGRTLFRSTNGGLAWNQLSFSSLPGESGYGPALSVCPADPNTVLYGNVGYQRSTDGGAHWTPIAVGDLHADYHQFVWDPDNNGVWACNDGGISHSLDKGATWSAASNVMPVTQFYTVDCERNEVGMMLGGTQDNNVLVAATPSLAWSDPALGSTEGDAYGVAVNVYAPTQVWAVSGEASDPLTFPRYRSDDGGTTWALKKTGIGASSLFGGSLVSDQVYPVHLYTNTLTDVYQSADAADSWTVSNPSPFTSIQSLNASSGVTGGAVLYVVDAVGGTNHLWVRDNGTWVDRTAQLPASCRPYRVVPHPWYAYASEAWLVGSANSPQGSLWHTTDRGQSWTNVTGDLPSVIPATDIVVNPHVTGEWYVSTFIGVWRTKDGGAHWEHWTNGMPPYAIVNDLAYIDLTPSGPFSIVAATYGRSIWKRDIAGEDVFPLATVCDAYVQEGDAGTTTAWFHVLLSSTLNQSAQVDWSTADSTATVAGGDYVAASGTLTLPVGASDAWIPVSVNGDHTLEPDEAFKVVLANPLRLGLAGPGVGHILDDDEPALAVNGSYGVNGTVNAAVTLGNAVYVGGSFGAAAVPTGGAVVLDPASAQPTATVMTDGNVVCSASDGAGGWYFGGSFAHVNGQPRGKVAHVFADGSLDPWNPYVDDIVFGIAPVHGRVFIGGLFTHVGGTPMPYLACVATGTGLPVAGFAPAPDGDVLAVAVDSVTAGIPGQAWVFVGGDFTHIAGAARGRGAMFLGPAGGLAAWNPAADGAISSIVAVDGNVYAAGSFAHVGSATRAGLAEFDLGGNARAWDPAPDTAPYCLGAGPSAIYVGGGFTTIGSAPRANLAAFDRTSGALTAWAPNPDGGVNAIAVSGATVYLGGAFANAGGAARTNVAAVDATSGLATGWAPAPNAVVVSITPGATNVFLGGLFNNIGSVPRSNLAAFDATTGALLPWNPGASSSVTALAAGSTTLYAGGAFTTIAGVARNRLAELDAATGAATSWDPNASATVRAILVTGSTTLAVGGQFTSVGGATRNRIAALSRTSGTATTWNPNANNTVAALATDGTYLYAGGSFTGIGAAARSGLAQLLGTTGAATAWNPAPDGAVRALLVSGKALFIGGDYTHIANVARARLSLIDLSTNTLANWSPTPNNSVDAIALTGGSTDLVAVGGLFTQVAGQPRSHFALLSVGRNVLSDVAPEPDGEVLALAPSGLTLWLGGAFNALAGRPHPHFGGIVSAASVDVPAAHAPETFAVSLVHALASAAVRIDYVLPVAARVQVSVHDVQGRAVGPRLDAAQTAGAHQLTWDGTHSAGVTPGVYFLRVRAGERTAVRKFVIL